MRLREPRRRGHGGTPLWGLSQRHAASPPRVSLPQPPPCPGLLRRHSSLPSSPRPWTGPSPHAADWAVWASEPFFFFRQEIIWFYLGLLVHKMGRADTAQNYRGLVHHTIQTISSLQLRHRCDLLNHAANPNTASLSEGSCVNRPACRAPPHRADQAGSMGPP